MTFATDHAAAAAPGHSTARADALAGPWLIACYAIVAALLAWPVLSVANPMLADYPNHLARLHVAAALDEIPALARHYVKRGGFYPYLPMDLIVGALRPLIGLEPAGKVFLVLSLLMPMAGAMAVARALHGRIGLWPLVVAPFCYNLLLVWGFTTYLFGLGLALFAFAGWIATERWSWLPRLALFSVISAIVFCSHPFAFAAYGLLFGAWEIGRTPIWSLPELRRTAGRIALAGLQVLPPVLIALHLPPADMGNDATLFGNVAARVIALFSPFFFSVDLEEIVCAIVLFAALAVAWRRGMLIFDRRMLWPVALVGAVSLVMPQTLAGIYLVHMRLPVLVVLLLLVACRPLTLPPKVAALGVALLLAVLGVRMTVAADRLAEADRHVAELRAAGRLIEPGARVMPAMSHDRIAALGAYHYWHAAAYWTIDRAAYSPLLFSFFNIDVVPELKQSSAPATSPVKFEILLTAEGEKPRVKLRAGQVNYWRDWRSVYDYVIDLDGGKPAAELPPELSVVQRGAIFTLYRIAK
jgi:hypothetical protein